MENLRKIQTHSSFEPEIYRYTNSSNVEMFESFFNDKKFSDIILETNDGFKIFGHKVILVSASPYFKAMITNDADKTKDIFLIKELDYSTLKPLVNFIYSGKITVIERNVQALLPAANFLLLNEVNEACCEFLQKQLRPTNCLSTKAFADLHNCTQLLKKSELYIQQNFSKVVKGDEFLFLSSEEVVKLISSDELAVQSEEKVFECVIRWVKHELDSRKCILHQLLEHVRLPLISENYIFQNVLNEPLLNNCPESCKCKDYIYEALRFHFLKRNQSDQVIDTPECIRYKPRQPNGLLKVILAVGGYGNRTLASTEWYDSIINRWQFGPEMITPRNNCGVAVLKDNFLFAVGGSSSEYPLQSVDFLDLSSESPCWKPTVDMLEERSDLGVGVINDYLYAVGGHDGDSALNSVEVFNISSQEWCMVSNMCTERYELGVGVLNNLLYAVGGFDDSSEEVLNSVECYHPDLNTWTPVAKMCKERCGLGVGVLNGVLYAVGGEDGSKTLKSVEAYKPSTGVWTTMADMHVCRKNAGVVALDGLLYAVGGRDKNSFFDSVEVYNPITNSWTMLGTPMNVSRHSAGVVAIGRPFNL